MYSYKVDQTYNYGVPYLSALHTYFVGTQYSYCNQVFRRPTVKMSTSYKSFFYHINSTHCVVEDRLRGCPLIFLEIRHASRL